MTQQPSDVVQQLETLVTHLKQQRDKLETLICERKKLSQEEAEEIRKLKNAPPAQGYEVLAANKKVIELKQGRLMAFNEMLFRLQQLQDDKKENLALLRSIIPSVERLSSGAVTAADNAPMASSVTGLPAR